MRKTFITIAAGLAALSGYAQDLEAGIDIDSRYRHQHVTGFGGFSPSPTWSYWLSNSDMDKLFGKGDGQLGLNILRLYMANSKGAWGAGVNNAKRAKKHGAFIFASPWSPPASWKSNNSDSNGGELLPARYKDWATFLNDYQLYMASQGVNIDAVSIQNEPDWNASYQSCIWSGSQMADFLRQYGHLIECQVVAPEAIHFTRSMHEPILNDPGACDNLDILGGHFYGWDGSSYPLAARRGKEVWMTEFLINERQQNNGLDINWKDDAFLFAGSVNSAMLADMSAWVHYSLKRYYGCIGDGQYGTVDGQITKRGYVLSHYAKYVSGTTRLQHKITDPSKKLSASAYITESGDSVVAMVLNPSDFSYEVTFTLPFTTVEGKSIVTTETMDMGASELEWDETWQAPVDVDPWSVSTFIFVRAGQRPGYTEDISGGESVFDDDFDLYGANCIPRGWRARCEEGTRYAGDYTLGPRIMAFSPEGVVSNAFYFRSGTNGTGYVSYGEEGDCRLSLEPGSYRLDYSLVGWKSAQDVKLTLKRAGGKTILTSSASPDVVMSDNGPSARIDDTCDYSVPFDLAEPTDLIMRWELTSASAGYREMLLGNVHLYRLDDSGICDILNDRDTADDTLYDLCGRRVHGTPAPGLYVRHGRKVLVR